MTSREDSAADGGRLPLVLTKSLDGTLAYLCGYSVEGETLQYSEP